MNVVVLEPLQAELRKGMRVLDRFDREGVIVGFHRRVVWAYRRPQFVAYLIVEFDNGRRPLRADELRVIQRRTEGSHVA